MFHNNNFTSNQGYISGNAIHARYTYNSTDLLTNTTILCGAGFKVSDNDFIDNTSVLHASNGGAISLVCDFKGALPNVPTSSLNMTQAQNAQTAYAEPIDLEVLLIKDFWAEIINN